MKRRSFLQSIIGGVTALFVGGAKTKPEPEYDLDAWAKRYTKSGGKIIDGRSWDPVKAAHTCVFRGYEITAFNNGIVCWDRVGEPSRVDILRMESHPNRFDLITYDGCKDLFISEDCVIWLGDREVWKIRYVGGNRVFIFCFLGCAEYFDRRKP